MLLYKSQSATAGLQWAHIVTKSVKSITLVCLRLQGPRKAVAFKVSQFGFKFNKDNSFCQTHSL